MSKYIYNVYIGNFPKDRRLFASCARSRPSNALGVATEVSFYDPPTMNDPGSGGLSRRSYCQSRLVPDMH